MRPAHTATTLPLPLSVLLLLLLCLLLLLLCLLLLRLLVCLFVGCRRGLGSRVLLRHVDRKLHPQKRPARYTYSHTVRRVERNGNKAEEPLTEKTIGRE